MELKKILVPLRDSSNADAEAVRLACSLAKEDNAEVHLIYVIEVERSRSLDDPMHSDMEKAEMILNDGEEVATSMGCKIVQDLCQARELGPAIVGEAEKGFDLIVIGVEYEKSLGVFDPGKTIRTIFRESPCHVLLYRSPIMEDIS